MPAFYDGQQDYINKLNEMYTAFAAGPYTAVPLAGNVTMTGPLTIPTLTVGAGGATGITKAMVGLSNVDNTSDAAKPISTATATALAGKQAALSYTPVQQGTGVGQSSNTIKIGWSGSRLKATVDSTDLGNIVTENTANTFSQLQTMVGGVLALQATSQVTSQGTAGYGAFFAKGSGVNPAHLFLGNVTNGETGRVSTNGTSRSTMSFSTIVDGMFAARALIDYTALYPASDGTFGLGGASNRWSQVYAAASTISTSDARLKTGVRQFSPAEIEAAKQLGNAIGFYKFLADVDAKGSAAREHCGMTVQRAIEIMASQGLDPMAYGFICFDSWPSQIVEHPEIREPDSYVPPIYNDVGDVEVDGYMAPGSVREEAWTETKPGGDLYSFRYDELNQFILAGINARLAALEVRGV